jgi:hypothetical protein
VNALKWTLAAGLAAIFLAGCASNSPTRLAKEVRRLVQVGMSAEAANRLLASAGFVCSSSYERGFDGLMCARVRPHRLIASCVQRANLSLGARRTVVKVETPPPACAGL